MSSARVPAWSKPFLVRIGDRAAERVQAEQRVRARHQVHAVDRAFGINAQLTVSPNGSLMRTPS